MAEKRRASAGTKRRRSSTPEIDFGDLPVTRKKFDRGTAIYAQGDSADTVMYVERGAVKLAVVSRGGKEAVVAVLEIGQFFGEGCLAGQPRRMASATAALNSTIVTIAKHDMVRRLHDDPGFAGHVLRHILTRNIRIEEDLIDQLFNSSEKRLARALVLLTHYGQTDTALRTAPRVSQTVLAEMIGTTRSRVNFFMNKFRRMGFIEYNGVLKINDSLLTVVLRE